MGKTSARRRQRRPEKGSAKISDAGQSHRDDGRSGRQTMTRRELLALAASGAFAAEHLNRAPVSHENLTVKLPEAEPVKLSNGVTLLAIEDSRLPIALVRFHVEDAGAIYSPHPGVAESTAEMLTEGGGGRSGKRIADEAARLGATLSSGAPVAAEAANVEASGLTSHFSEWL